MKFPNKKIKTISFSFSKLPNRKNVCLLLKTKEAEHTPLAYIVPTKYAKKYKLELNHMLSHLRTGKHE